MVEAVGIQTLGSLQGASRAARSYAFLNAAFKRTESGSSPVRDAVDCLIPFIAPYTHSIAGAQIDLTKLQQYLRSTFGFDIPLYALESLVHSLQQHGYARYEPSHRVYIATPKQNDFAVAKEEIETEFDEIAVLLASHARSLGFEMAPPAGSWDEALIQFLKPDTAPSDRKVVNLKSVIVDARDAERKVVASFLSKLYEDQPHRFEKVVRIFMGVLIEDFLSSVTEIGAINRASPLIVLYDTTVLLRALACSGKLFKIATDELTRYLQDIGCEIRFLPGNESEVDNVIGTILNVKDSGHELEGETADAISKGEVSISQLRMLQNNFVEQLAAMNIFEHEDSPGTAQLLSQHQINEGGLAAYLQEQAVKRGRNYGYQNRMNDSGYVGTVMRLRKGIRTKDLAVSGVLFVTANRLLAAASRAFLIKEKQLTHLQCPPVLHLSQVATIAWLLKDQKLKPEKAGRELLTNCYAAIRPDAEWFKNFREGIQKVVGDFETFANDGSNAFLLKAARRIAQEESFSNSNIMRELNAVEILDRSRKLLEEQQEADAARHSTEMKAAIERARAEERSGAEAELDLRVAAWANKRSAKIMRVLQFCLAVAFVAALALDQFLDFESASAAMTAKVVLGVAALLSFLDLLGISFVRAFFDYLRQKVSRFEANRKKRGLH